MEQRLNNQAFSLLELLAVIAIIAILSILVVPAAGSLFESNNLSRAAELVADQVDLAQQLARTQNCSMEVRLVKDATNKCNAIQIWSTASGTATTPASRLIQLPESISLSQNTQYSPLLQYCSSGVMPSPSPRAGQGYYSFKIRNEGAVEPIPTAAQRSLLYVTLLADKYSSRPTLPSNFVTLQLNPDTGSVLSYRP